MTSNTRHTPHIPPTSDPRRHRRPLPRPRWTPALALGLALPILLLASPASADDAGMIGIGHRHAVTLGYGTVAVDARTDEDGEGPATRAFDNPRIANEGNRYTLDYTYSEAHTLTAFGSLLGLQAGTALEAFSIDGGNTLYNWGVHAGFDTRSPLVGGHVQLRLHTTLHAMLHGGWFDLGGGLQFGVPGTVTVTPYASIRYASYALREHRLGLEVATALAGITGLLVEAELTRGEPRGARGFVDYSRLLVRAGVTFR